MSTEGARELPLEIGHVLFVDIVGYSKLLTEEQTEALHELNRIVLATAAAQAAQSAGQLIRLPTGDGMALVFRHSPEAPVQCALELSRADKAHPGLQLRMGIHSGPINQVTDVNERVNVTGAGINLAQRVMDCGDAGHILLSQHVADDLEHYPRWRPLLHALGGCEVKHGVRIPLVNLYADGLGNPQLPRKLQAIKQSARRRRLAIFAGLLILAVVILLARPKLFASDKSIAVLPFENLSSEKENAYFAEGIQDEILTRLSKIADLKVISRTSTEHYKSAPKNLREIGQQLGVAHFLEGSVQKSGDAVRVNVQLIKAANDSHLWADTFDRKLTDIFAVESEVAKAIADQLRARLTGAEEKVIANRPTENPAAHDAYLRGLEYNLRTANSAENSRGAQRYLQEAVRLDPKFALAWALLSYVDARGYLTQTLQPTDALREEARQAAAAALNLQPDLGEALHAQGYYYYACLKDYDTAVRYFEQAGKLLPNSSRIPESLAYVTRRQGQWDRSLTYFDQAERLDPRNVYVLGQHAQSLMALRRFPEATRKFDQILNITPGDVDIISSQGGVAQAQGDLPRAAKLLAPLRPVPDDSNVLYTKVYQAILERNPAPVIPRLQAILAQPDLAWGYGTGERRFWLGWAQDVAGDHAAAQETWRIARVELEPFLKEQSDNYNLLYDLALTMMGLGEKEAALAYAERAMAAMPIEKDAFDGPAPIEILARVAAQVGEPERAITALQKILSVPYEGPLGGAQAPLTKALLRLDPMFDPLRGDPRFEKIVTSLAPKNPK